MDCSIEFSCYVEGTRIPDTTRSRTHDVLPRRTARSAATVSGAHNSAKLSPNANDHSVVYTVLVGCD